MNKKPMICSLKFNFHLNSVQSQDIAHKFLSLLFDVVHITYICKGKCSKNIFTYTYSMFTNICENITPYIRSLRMRYTY